MFVGKVPTALTFPAIFFCYLPAQQVYDICLTLRQKLDRRNCRFEMQPSSHCRDAESCCMHSLAHPYAKQCKHATRLTLEMCQSLYKLPQGPVCPAECSCGGPSLGRSSYLHSLSPPTMPRRQSQATSYHCMSRTCVLSNFRQLQLRTRHHLWYENKLHMRVSL